MKETTREQFNKKFGTAFNIGAIPDKQTKGNILNWIDQNFIERGEVQKVLQTGKAGRDIERDGLYMNDSFSMGYKTACEHLEKLITATPPPNETEEGYGHPDAHSKSDNVVHNSIQPPQAIEELEPNRIYKVGNCTTSINPTNSEIIEKLNELIKAHNKQI